MKTEQYGVVTSIQNNTGGLVLKGHFVNVHGQYCNSEEDYNLKLGVCLADTPADEMMPVAVTGIVLCVTGAAINRGTPVRCDPKIYPMLFADPPTTYQLQTVVGKALDAASGADEVIRVLLK